MTTVVGVASYETNFSLPHCSLFCAVNSSSIFKQVEQLSYDEDDSATANEFIECDYSNDSELLSCEESNSTGRNETNKKTIQDAEKVAIELLAGRLEVILYNY